MVSINELANLIMGIAGKKVDLVHIPGPLGVRGRNSDNRLILRKLGWSPSQDLQDGLNKTYPWIVEQIALDLAPPSGQAIEDEIPKVA